MDEKIVLDREAFKVLASDTRVGILKSLARQRKTLTELSREFGMSVSTVKEHLDNLSGAELIVQIDDGHKWKYYELTRKGRDILNPGETRIWILISLSGITALVTAFDMVRRAVEPPAMLAARDVLKSPVQGPEAFPVASAPAAGLPLIHVAIIAASLILFAVGLVYLLMKRRKMSS
jgi:DNA-binding transcriptional ArsR family regulator